jgi:hypothetical protein
MNGQPAGRGRICFVPVGDNGAPVTSSIASDGSYTLQTVEPGDGARLGEYQVVITSREEEHLSPAEIRAKNPAKKVARDHIMKYENPNTSRLTATVKSGKNPLNFNLE